MPKKRITTVEELARLSQEEFLGINVRFDRLEGKVDRLEEKVDTGFRAIVDTLDLMQADVRDIKVALGPLASIVGDLDQAVRSLDKRVGRLEERRGLAK